jgi:hypothetical protein
VRRIATAVLIVCVATGLLLIGTAWGGAYDLTLVNKTPSDVKIEVFQPKPDSFRHYDLRSVHHQVDPNSSFHAGDLGRGTCVLVRVVNDSADANAKCEGNPTPLDLRCDVPPQYSCEVHSGEIKDAVVIKIVQPGA